MPYYVKRRSLEKVAGHLVLAFVTVFLHPLHAQTFSEEFDAAQLNFLKWSPHPPGKWLIGGIQTWIPTAITLSGGQAHITARKDNTSGILTTFGSFAQTWGRFEIRMRVPRTPGVEALVQLLPVPAGDTPSIDILSVDGADPTNAGFANRWIENNLDHDYTGSYKGPDLSSGFHTIAVEWDEDKIVWRIDGAERFRSEDGIPRQAMYLAIGLKIIKPLDHDATLDIDRVHIYPR